MAIVAAKLVETQLIPASTTTVFANPANQKTYVQGIFLHNTHTSAVDVDIWNVPDNAAAVGTAGAANKKFRLSVAADDTVQIDLGKPGFIQTDQNDSIQVQASVASVVNIEISGFTEDTTP